VIQRGRRGGTDAVIIENDKSGEGAGTAEIVTTVTPFEKFREEDASGFGHDFAWIVRGLEKYERLRAMTQESSDPVRSFVASGGGGREFPKEVAGASGSILRLQAV